ncbi:TonB-dependent receptor [Altererythrobacter soli]|uniref:TonB-dependent receptor n=1 Tax=Croceibacterium soli TaxID=1739690 RepID=A0A6I4USS9_9SPHN|nr:TonB-dependent receptor [Croceibacterium soli]MXP40814.1 TonB-dependent receptor [Croceibacterium soli]
MGKTSANRAGTRVSLLSAAAAVTMLSVAAIAEEAAAEDTEQDRDTRAGDIIVTAGSLTSPDMPATTPVRVLTGDELAHRRQGGLGETLAGLPGVHLDNFGGGASRPVIRGQTLPRIEILSDGANLFDASSVSPDHAIATDPLLLDAIEIQRGPAAIRYGGNALNGAINLIDGKVPKAVPERGYSGAMEFRLGTGDEEKTIVGRVTSGLGRFAVHAEGSWHAGEDYEVPNAFGTDKLKDSFADGSSYSFGASLITPKGYIGAAYTRQDSDYGLPGHSHRNAVCHTHGGPDLHCAAHDEFTDYFGSSDDHTASIKLRSERVDVRADYADLLPGFYRVRLRGSYTDYRHDEIDGPALFSHYTNEVHDGRIELTHKPLLGSTGTFGVQYTHGTFTGLNINDLHILDDLLTEDAELFGFFDFVPPYDHVTKNVGMFLSERRSFGPVHVELGIRKDWRDISLPPGQFVVILSPELEAIYLPLLLQIYGPDWRNAMREDAIKLYARNNPGTKNGPLSASLGATWDLDGGYSVALSLARTERAPNLRELYAYGNNLATNSYEVGLTQSRRASSSFPESRTDVLETARSIDLTVRKRGGPLEFEIGLFRQEIDDYVFARLIETDSESGIPHNYLLYTAADARFTGIDGQAGYRLSPVSRLTVFGDYVGARLKDGNDNLPRISPGRLGGRYEWALGPISADAEYYRTFAQNRSASYETRTGGYDMVNATLAYRFDRGSGKYAELYARGTNFTNELALSHTSFVKNQSPLRGRSIVFGMRQQF